MTARHWGREAGAIPALLLHCSLASSGIWAGVARRLEGVMPLVAPDLPGHGGAPDWDGAGDYHDAATAAAATHLPDAPCHVVGHSLGATIALRLALDHPDRVRALVLIEPVLFCASDGPGRAAHDRAFAALPRALARGDAEGATRVFIDLWGAAPYDTLPDATRAALRQRIWVPGATEPALVHDRAGILARLPSLRVPTLILRGERALPVIPEIALRLARDIDGARLATIAGAGHMAPATHPAATAAELAAFLGPLGAGPGLGVGAGAGQGPGARPAGGRPLRRDAP